MPVNHATVYSRVRAVNLKTKETEWYNFNERNCGDVFLSRESPVGKALLGKEIGETVEILTPSGNLILKIIDICETKKYE